MDDFGNNLINEKFNMASTVKMIKSFEEEEEDINVWIRDVMLIAEVAGISRAETVKVIIMS